MFLDPTNPGIGEFRGAATVAGKNVAVAKRADDAMAMMMADWMLGVSHHLLGDQASAWRHCETALKPARQVSLKSRSRSIDPLFAISRSSRRAAFYRSFCSFPS